MKLKPLGLTFVLAVLALAWISRPSAQAAAESSKQAWEYKFVAGSPDDGHEKDLGAAGWELVTVTPPNQQHTGVYWFYFKRAK
jgi:hypothetical protein